MDKNKSLHEKLDEKIDKLLELFLKDKPETSQSAYLNALKYFSEFIKMPIKNAIKRLISNEKLEMHSLVLNFKTDMLNKKLSPNTINLRLAVLRSLIKLANKMDMTNNLLLSTNVPSKIINDMCGPSDVEIMLIKNSIIKSGTTRRKEITALRDMAIFSLNYYLGLRISEIINIKIQDTNIKDGYIKFYSKKVDQKININDNLKLVLTDWINVRNNEQNSNSLYLFTNRSAACKNSIEKLSRPGQYLRIKKIGERSGITGKLSSNRIRHSAITQALNKTNGNIQAVSEFARHKNINSTKLFDDSIIDFHKKISDLL